MEISEMLMEEIKLKLRNKRLQFFSGIMISFKFSKPEIPGLNFKNTNKFKLH